MPQFLAIDLGTSSVKVLLVSEDGTIVGRGSAEYAIARPRPDYAEQDPDAWWRAALAAIRQALSAALGATVAAIGLSGQMHGTVLLDRSGRPVAPAIIWPDQRSRLQVAEITRLVGAERLIGIAGSPVAPGFQAATIRWLQQERPGLWRQIHSVLLPKDYLRRRLGGEPVTEPSDASGTLLFDVRARDWSGFLLDALDIPRDRLPPVAPSTAVVGRLGAEAAGEMGLNGGIPLVAGAADVAAGLLGAGVTQPDSLLLTLGTGGQMAIPALNAAADPGGRTHTFCSALSPSSDLGGWYRMGAILSAGLALRWLRDNIFMLDGAGAFERMSAWAAAAPPGAGGLIFLPYLVGERTPHMNPSARALFLGLTARHGRQELVRAVMEGVVLACYDACEVLRENRAAPERLVLAGGGARSHVWSQIVADVFGRRVHRLRTEEQSAMGAALLAGAGVDALDLGDAARAWAAYGEPLEPDRERHERYQALLPLFRAAYRNHCADFDQLQQLEEQFHEEGRS